LTAAGRAGRQIVDRPPLLTRVTGPSAERIGRALDNYLVTLAPHWRRVVAGYTLVDVAHKVVGVSSVGLRSYVALLEGSSPQDVIFLQLKQAQRSVVARYVHGESARHAHQVSVVGTKSAATVSDPLLGWTTIDGVLTRPAVSRHEGRDSDRRNASSALNAYARILAGSWPRGMPAPAERR
jgi:uncharacterized protein (DUF2252 family)